MTTDPALPPSDVVDVRSIAGDVGRITRRAQYTPTTIPSLAIGGTPRDSGYQSTSSTSYVEMFRADCYVSAPYLAYDIQTSDAYAGTPPASVEFEITATTPYNASLPASTTLVTSGGAVGEYAATVDLRTLISPLVIGEYLSLRVTVKMTGGTGDGAGIRMVAPMALRAVG